MEGRIKAHPTPLPKGANYTVPDVWDWDRFEYSPLFEQHRQAAQAPSLDEPSTSGRRLLAPADGTDDDPPADPLAAAALDLDALQELAVPVMPDVVRAAAQRAHEPLINQEAFDDDDAMGSMGVVMDNRAASSGRAGTTVSGDMLDPMLDPDAEEPGVARGRVDDAFVAGTQDDDDDGMMAADDITQQQKTSSKTRGVDTSSTQQRPINVLEVPPVAPGASVHLADDLPASAEFVLTSKGDAVVTHDGQPRVSLLETDGPRVKFAPKPTGTKAQRLDGGRTPMEQHEYLSAKPDTFVWGKVEPWEVPENSGKVETCGGGALSCCHLITTPCPLNPQFVRDHLRMTDVRLYIRDLLREYAALQAFVPVKKPNSVCYTGQLLLEQFGRPHARDEHILRQSYPWLEDFDNGCPELPQPPAKTAKRLRRTTAHHAA